MKDLHPIATPHPAIVIGSLALLGVMIFRSLETQLQEPPLWLGTAVIVLVIVANEMSRRSRLSKHARSSR